MPDIFRNRAEADAHLPDRNGASWRNALRSSSYVLRRINRLTERLHAEDKDYFLRPPVVVNSLPHSGARLLLQLAHAFPETRWYGITLASLPTIPFRERSDLAHDRLIRRIVPGEIIAAHLFFNDGHARRIAARNGVHFFLLRDLRDVAVAEAHELTYVKFWHRLHPFFAGLKNDAERVSAAIRGLAHDRFPYHYPNIAHRFARYNGWLNRYDVMCVRYEDLHSERFAAVIREMVRFYARQRRKPPDEAAVARDVRRMIAVERAASPRAAAPGAWMEVFTDEHHRQFEEIAGELNRRLGYGDTPDREIRAKTAGPAQTGRGEDRSGVLAFPAWPKAARQRAARAAGENDTNSRQPRRPPRGR